MHKKEILSQMEFDLNSIGQHLAGLYPKRVTSNASLKELSRWRVGGYCTWLVEPENVEEVAQLIKILKENKIKYIVIGDGSNVLFDSKGLNAVVIKIGRLFSNFKIQGNKVYCQAGAWVPQIARNVALAGLKGMQHTIGIPGTLGGLVYMNGGSQRKGIGENVQSVTVIKSTGEIVKYNREDCLFLYRRSVFQNSGSIILEVEMEFDKGLYKELRREMLSIMASRRLRFPLKLPNCGSVFVSDPEMYEVVGPPGKAIELSGLKGLSLGGAQFSNAHANFIVNNGNATSDDILNLIKVANYVVKSKTGYSMKTEVLFINQLGDVLKPDTII